MKCIFCGEKIEVERVALDLTSCFNCAKVFVKKVRTHPTPLENLHLAFDEDTILENDVKAEYEQRKV